MAEVGGLDDFLFQGLILIGVFLALPVGIFSILGICLLRDKIWPPCEHDWQPTGREWITDEFSGGPGSKGGFMAAMGEWLNIEERCAKCGEERIDGHWA